MDNMIYNLKNILSNDAYNCVENYVKTGQDALALIGNGGDIQSIVNAFQALADPMFANARATWGNKLSATPYSVMQGLPTYTKGHYNSFALKFRGNYGYNLRFPLLNSYYEATSGIRNYGVAELGEIFAHIQKSFNFEVRYQKEAPVHIQAKEGAVRKITSKLLHPVRMIRAKTFEDKIDPSHQIFGLGKAKLIVSQNFNGTTLSSLEQVVAILDFYSQKVNKKVAKKIYNLTNNGDGAKIKLASQILTDLTLIHAFDFGEKNARQLDNALRLQLSNVIASFSNDNSVKMMAEVAMRSTFVLLKKLNIRYSTIEDNRQKIGFDYISTPTTIGAVMFGETQNTYLKQLDQDIYYVGKSNLFKRINQQNKAQELFIAPEEEILPSPEKQAAPTQEDEQPQTAPETSILDADDISDQPLYEYSEEERKLLNDEEVKQPDDFDYSLFEDESSEVAEANPVEEIAETPQKEYLSIEDLLTDATHDQGKTVYFSELIDGKESQTEIQKDLQDAIRNASAVDDALKTYVVQNSQDFYYDMRPLFDQIEQPEATEEQPDEIKPEDQKLKQDVKKINLEDELLKTLEYYNDIIEEFNNCNDCENFDLFVYDNEKFKKFEELKYFMTASEFYGSAWDQFFGQEEVSNFKEAVFLAYDFIDELRKKTQNPLHSRLTDEDWAIIDRSRVKSQLEVAAQNANALKQFVDQKQASQDDEDSASRLILSDQKLEKIQQIATKTQLEMAAKNAVALKQFVDQKQASQETENKIVEAVNIANALETELNNKQGEFKFVDDRELTQTQETQQSALSDFVQDETQTTFADFTEETHLVKPSILFDNSGAILCNPVQNDDNTDGDGAELKADQEVISTQKTPVQTVMPTRQIGYRRKRKFADYRVKKILEDKAEKTQGTSQPQGIETSKIQVVTPSVRVEITETIQPKRTRKVSPPKQNRAYDALMKKSSTTEVKVAQKPKIATKKVLVGKCAKCTNHMTGKCGCHSAEITK